MKSPTALDQPLSPAVTDASLSELALSELPSPLSALPTAAAPAAPPPAVPSPSLASLAPLVAAFEAALAVGGPPASPAPAAVTDGGSGAVTVEGLASLLGRLQHRLAADAGADAALAAALQRAGAALPANTPVKSTSGGGGGGLEGGGRPEESSPELSGEASAITMVAAAEAGKAGVAEPPEAMISFKRFAPGCLVLFLPVHSKKLELPGQSDGAGAGPGLFYLAFNEAQPRHYLSDESVALFKARNRDKLPHFLVGRVIFIERRVAGRLGDADANPYQVSEGAVFHVVTVESI